MKTVHRIITLEGPNSWVDTTMARSLPDGPYNPHSGALPASADKGLVHVTVLNEAGGPNGGSGMKLLVYNDKTHPVYGHEFPWRAVIHWWDELDPLVDVRGTTKERAEGRALLRLKYLAHDIIRFVWVNRHKTQAGADNVRPEDGPPDETGGGS